LLPQLTVHVKRMPLELSLEAGHPVVAAPACCITPQSTYLSPTLRVQIMLLALSLMANPTGCGAANAASNHICTSVVAGERVTKILGMHPCVCQYY
jgi:hypothetical protein